MTEDGKVYLSNIISVNVTTGAAAPPLTIINFIEMSLRMMWGPREHDELVAAKMLGGLGFAARRKARRQRILATAREIAARVGHGEEREPMFVHPDFTLVPMSMADDAKIIFSETQKDIASVVGLPPRFIFGTTKETE